MTTPSTVRRSARDRDRGDAMVGFVIAFPLAFLLVALLVQAVMVAWADNAAQHAALAAVREARVEGGSDAAADSVARDMLSQVGFAHGVDVTVDRGPDVVTVTVSTDVTSIVPFWTPTVGHTASGPVERFVPGDQP